MDYFAIAKLFLRFLTCTVFLGLCGLSAKLDFERTQISETVTLDAKTFAFAFPFENKGEQPVEIREIKTSCGCTVANLEKRVYQPGEKGEIKGSYNIGSRQGKQRNTVRVYTDDLGQPEISLSVEVEIPQIMTLKPGLLLWRTDAEPLPKSIMLTPNKELGVEITGVECESEDFAIELIPSEESSGEHELVVVPTSLSESKRVLLKVHVKLPNELKPRVFFAHVMVR